MYDVDPLPQKLAELLEQLEQTAVDDDPETGDETDEG